MLFTTKKFFVQIPCVEDSKHRILFGWCFFFSKNKTTKEKQKEKEENLFLKHQSIQKFYFPNNPVKLRK